MRRLEGCAKGSASAHASRRRFAAPQHEGVGCGSHSYAHAPSFRRASSLVRHAARWLESHRTRGRRVTDPVLVEPVTRRPVCGDFCSLASRTSRISVAFATSIRSQPVKSRQPGRIAGRAGHSAPFLLHARRFRRARVSARRRLQEPPETWAPIPMPQAPLPARIARHGNRTTP